MFPIHDRDLLAHEPTLFRDFSIDSQLRVTADDGVISDTTLSSASSDYVSAEVGEGSVVQIGRVTLEVLSRLSATQLSVSAIRDSRDRAPIPPQEGADLSFRISTFTPQIKSALDEIRNALGIRDDTAVLANPSLERLIVFKAFHLIFTAAAASAERSDPRWARALWYLERYEQELRRARVLLDNNGDGEPDSERALQPARFVRE